MNESSILTDFTFVLFYFVESDLTFCDVTKDKVKLSISQSTNQIKHAI